MNIKEVPIELKELITEDEIIMFEELQIKIEELNNKTNLTKLIKGDDYWINQVYDSVWPFRENKKNIFNNKKFIDIGSGCGFPGFGYAITHPYSEIYLLDSSKKKTASLKKIIKEINFKNKIHIITDRIENFARQSFYRNSFNIATARAVSNPSTVAEYILPMLKLKGYGLLYCAKWDSADQKALEKTLDILEGKIIEVKNIFLPKNRGIRNIIFIQPRKACSVIYPRGIGKAEKYPLNS